MNDSRKNETDLLRILVSFAVAEGLLVIAAAIFGGSMTAEWQNILFNIAAVLGVNTAAYLLICGKPQKTERKSDYSRTEPAAFLFAGVLLACAAAFIVNLAFPEKVVSAQTPSVLTIVYTVVLAPIAEETAFRGSAMTRLRDMSEDMAAILSALFFAAYHMDLRVAPYMAVLGYFLAKLKLRSGSIIPCIFVHAANNLITLLAGISEEISLAVDIALPILGTASLLWLILTKRLWRKRNE